MCDRNDEKMIASVRNTFQKCGRRIEDIPKKNKFLIAILLKRMTWDKLI